MAFARRLDAEVEISETYLADLRRYIDAYDRGGGVEGPTKNLIFAANGPKPDIVLRDAVSNDIEIVANAEIRPVYEEPYLPAEGLRLYLIGGGGLVKDCPRPCLMTEPLASSCIGAWRHRWTAKRRRWSSRHTPAATRPRMTSPR